MTSDQTAVLYWIGFPAVFLLAICIYAMVPKQKGLKQPRRGGKADLL
jgi:hypothetical protein